MFTKEEIEELLRNKNVSKCSSKAITYSKEFKVDSVKKYYEGYSPKMMFEEAGFDLKIIGTDRAKASIKRWRKTYNEKGEEELMRGKQGRSGRKKKKIEFKNKDEKIKYLETKIKYLDAQNDFLAKLRGLKRE